MKNYFLLLIIAAIIFTGCGGTRTATTNSGDYYYSPVKERAEEDARIVIYNASLDMIVGSIDSANAALFMIAKNHGGYAVEIGTYQSTIRVKAEELNIAIDEIELLGEVNSKNITGSDVTEEYTDFQIRLENARKARDRYLELLAKAENVEAALLVEKELERLNAEIELLEGKINKLGHLAEYSTITIDLREKVKLGVLGYVSVGLYEGVKWLFVRN